MFYTSQTRLIDFTSVFAGGGILFRLLRLEISANTRLGLYSVYKKYIGGIGRKNDANLAKVILVDIVDF